MFSRFKKMIGLKKSSKPQSKQVTYNSKQAVTTPKKKPAKSGFIKHTGKVLFKTAKKVGKNVAKNVNYAATHKPKPAPKGWTKRGAYKTNMVDQWNLKNAIARLQRDGYQTKLMKAKNGYGEAVYVLLSKPKAKRKAKRRTTKRRVVTYI